MHEGNWMFKYVSQWNSHVTCVSTWVYMYFNNTCTSLCPDFSRYICTCSKHDVYIWTMIKIDKDLKLEIINSKQFWSVLLRILKWKLVIFVNLLSFQYWSSTNIWKKIFLTHVFRSILIIFLVMRLIHICLTFKWYTWT